MIYLKFVKPPTCVQDVITRLFSYVDCTLVYNIETYNDPEFKSVQCRARKIRSFEDTCEIVKTYFPEATIVDVLKAILSHKIDYIIDREGKPYKMYPFLRSCSNIYKINFYYSNECQSYYNIINWPKLNSHYSWKELLELIDITDDNSYFKFLNNGK